MYVCIDVAAEAPCVVVAESAERSSLEEEARRVGCEIFKEQGEELYRVICPLAVEAKPLTVEVQPTETDLWR